jgi:hypothetical protein
VHNLQRGNGYRQAEHLQLLHQIYCATEGCQNILGLQMLSSPENTNALYLHYQSHERTGYGSVRGKAEVDNFVLPAQENKEMTGLCFMSLYRISYR